ncbi:phenylacetate--CoA ligase family protein [Candidatus Marifrigoribacter sp. Uisw_064]|uniref:phenylacetate--CoA ligase family protein n=1 Tax=Candidatus Marifrigoribacter sp. Uisw_064 TaxID=3230970 RepID=UPI003D54F5CB
MIPYYIALNFFESILKLNGYPIQEAKKQLAEIQNIPENEYEAHIFKQRKSIVEYHLKHNSFYKSFLGSSSTEKWEDIPIMRKKDLQIPLKDRISQGFNIKKCYVSKTSGSSGTPLVFAKDKYCHALTWAGIIDRFGWFSIDFNHSYQARFYGIPLSFFAYQKERLKDRLSHRFRFPIFDLSEKKLEEFLSVFRKKKFFFINGHTSSIVLFAKYLKEKKLILTDVCPSLKYCVVTSEMLYDSDKKLLQEILNVPIINEYGASEIDLIAFTNSKDEFIVNSETLFVEILDEENNSVPNGEVGKVVITSLYNKAQPLIRYEVGDAGILSPKGTLKTPILQELVGRSNDIAYLPSGKTVPGHTLYYVTKSVIEDDGNVKEFIVEQLTLETFKIIYVSDTELQKEQINTIHKAMTQYLEEGLSIQLEKVAVLDRSNRGKLKQFTSNIEQK